MEQFPPSNPAITWWLADYTHFICDQLRLSHEQGDRLFQQYHWLTTGQPPPQPASSLNGNPTAYPEMRINHHDTHSHDQFPCPPLQHGRQNLPMSNSGPSDLPHKHSLGEEVNHASNSTVMTAPNVMPQGLFSSYDQQHGQITSDLDVPETISPSMQSTGPSNHNPIGSVADYDPLWVQYNNISPMTVKNYRTSMKFDTLFNHHVIRPGDILTFQVTVTADGQHLKTEAHLKVPHPSPLAGQSPHSPDQIIGSSKAQGRAGKFPDLSVTLLSDPSWQYPIATSCQGTKSMIEHLERTCNMTVLKPTWQDIQVVRGEQVLGNLRYFTNAFHLWRDWKDQEARETGQFFRLRRPQQVKDTTNPVVHHNGRCGVWQEGVFMPDPNQDQFRVRG